MDSTIDLKLPLRAAGIALVCVFVSACGGGDGDGAAKTGAPAASAAPAAKTAAAPAATPAEPPAAPKGDTPPAATGDAPAPAAAGGHSAVPTVAEWQAVTGEVTVLGSSALDCETKGLREWIRVSCRGDDKKRGTPTAVTVANAKSAETFTFASGGVSSLVYRFEEGIKVEATFRWERLTKRFVAEWPPGAPKPTAYGRFL